MAGQRFRMEPPTFLSTIPRFEKSEIPPSTQEPYRIRKQEEGPNAESIEARMGAGSGKFGHCRGRAASHDGIRHDIRGKGKWLECLQRSPIRRPAGRRPALASPDTCGTLDWHAQGGFVCSGMHASWGIHAGRDTSRSERRL